MPSCLVAMMNFRGISSWNTAAESCRLTVNGRPVKARFRNTYKVFGIVMIREIANDYREFILRMASAHKDDNALSSVMYVNPFEAARIAVALP